MIVESDFSYHFYRKRNWISSQIWKLFIALPKGSFNPDSGWYNLCGGGKYISKYHFGLTAPVSEITDLLSSFNCDYALRS